MIDLGFSLEQLMYGSVSFAAIVHGLEVGAKRHANWMAQRRWRKQDEEWAALNAAAMASQPVAAEAEVVKTKKSK